MKVGNLEGTPEEIRGLLIAGDLHLSDYLEKPEEPLKRIWLAIPAIPILIAFVLLATASGLSKSAILLMFLIGTASAIWLAVSIQIRFKNAWATSVVVIGGLLLMLVAAGYLAPKDTVDAIKALKQKSSSE